MQRLGELLLKADLLSPSCGPPATRHFDRCHEPPHITWGGLLGADSETPAPEGLIPFKQMAPGKSSYPPTKAVTKALCALTVAGLLHRRGLWWVGLLHELWALYSGLPPLWPALGLVDLHHKEGQDHHGSQEGKDRNGLAHLLVVAARHDPSRNVPGTTFSRRQGSHLRAI